MSSLPRKTRLKTFSHLGCDRKMPTEYEIASSRLLWYVERGFEVKTPLGEWFQRHQRQSPLRCADWERFSDPRRTTYSLYARLQSRQESFVEQLLESDTGPAERFAQVMAPLRFAVHGLQMLAAYVGHLAPSGRITLAAAFQAADEARRIQWIAYRTAQLRAPDAAREVWQDEPSWQPLRKLIEQMLIVWDWAECFVALNLCLKPLFDRLFMVELPRLHLGERDQLLFGSLDADCQWHRAWALALVRLVENRDVLLRWLDTWGRRAEEAVAPFMPLTLEEFHRACLDGGAA